MKTKETGVLYKPNMIKAINEYLKDRTRRQLPEYFSQFESAEIVVNPTLCNPKSKKEIEPLETQGTYASFNGGEEHVKCKYGNVGDLLYIKEPHYAYGYWKFDGGLKTKNGKLKCRFIDLTPHYLRGIYKFDDDLPNQYHILKGFTNERGWYKRSALFMPKKAARVWLQITKIGIERLQDIKHDDAINEGLYREWDGTHYWYENYLDPGKMTKNPITSFKSLWISINGAESWDANPWVWVITFEKVKL